MTKEELKRLVEEQQETIEELQNDVDYWEYQYDDIYNQYNELEEEIEKLKSKNNIEIEDFIWQLKINNLYTKEMEAFIDEYNKYK